MKDKKILAFERPDLLKEWDYEKNSLICSPDVITIGSGKKVWWICPKGHSYSMAIFRRTGEQHGNCPYCSNQKVLTGYNDLQTNYPEIAKEWDYKKNTVSPKTVAKKSNKVFWWICRDCGRSYKSAVFNRVNGHGCPYCSNQKVITGETDLQTNYPEIAKEWDYKKNGELKPSDVLSKTHKRVWWICPEGHSYQAQVSSRTHKKTGCPICNGLLGTSFQEQAIFFYLSKLVNVINRYIVDGYEIDIYLPDYKIGIEYDGQFYHSSNRSKAKEKKKNDYFEKAGIELYRVKESNHKDYSDEKNLKYIYKENNQNLDDVISQLFSVLRKSIPLSSVDIDANKDKMLILAEYMKYRRKNSISELYPELMKEWNYEKNGNINPESINAGSHHKVWWKCKNGHEWEAAIKSRTINSNGCPYCSKKKLLIGYNDLATTSPELLEEWDYDKNSIDPSKITSGYKRKVWWKCKKCGHEWEARVYSRYQGYGCPRCGVKKSLKTRANKIPDDRKLINKFPALVEEWNYDKNIIDISEVSIASSKKVWWKCKKCGHEWEAIVCNRTRRKGNGCPRCAGRKRSIKCIEKNMIFNTITEAAKWAHANSSSISNCLNGRCETSAGYHWKYVDED